MSVERKLRTARRRPTPLTAAAMFCVLVLVGMCLPALAQQGSPPAKPEGKAEYYAIVPHTHADLSWPDTPKVCLDALVHSIGGTLEILKKYPDFKFSMETVYPLEEFLARYPEKSQEIRSLIRRDVFDCGALYTGPWEGTCGPEGLVRQLYYGKKWLKDHFDMEVTTAWNPDLPGHTTQLPQILAKAGVKGFVTWREFTGPPVHWWESPDGSKVLRVECFGGYGHPLPMRVGLEAVRKQSPAFLAGYRDLAGRTGVPLDLPIFVADGTDIELPSEMVPRILNEWNAAGDRPPMTMQTGTEYIRRAMNEAGLPTVRGEQPSSWDKVSCQAVEMARALRDAQAALPAGETFSAVASWLDPSFAYPQGQLDRAWRLFLIVCEHNFGGRNGEISDAVKQQQALAARDLAVGVRDAAVGKIARRVRPVQQGIPIVVFNPLSWERKDVVQTTVLLTDAAHRELHLVDASGGEVPTQIVRAERRDDGSIIQAEIVFEAQAPPVGYASYYLREGKGKLTSPFKSEGNAYENDFWRVEIDPQTGSIARLFSKKLGREMADVGKYGFGELVLIGRKGNDIEYEPSGVVNMGRQFKPDRIEVVENGPVRMVVRVEGPLADSRRAVDLALYRSLDKLGLTTRIDWNGAKDWELRQVFPVKVEPKAALTYEVPFASVRLGEENPFSATKPVHRGVQNWVDRSDEGGGLTLATRHAAVALTDSLPKPSQDPLVQPLLLLTVHSCHDAGSYYTQKGRHVYEFALHAHAGPVRKAAATREGWEFNSPLLAVVGAAAPGAVLPAARSFLAIDSPGVLLSTLKRAEHAEEGWILRCWEADGTKAAARFRSSAPLAGVERVNMVEEGSLERMPFGADGFEATLGPAAIETYRLRLAGGSAEKQ